MSARAVVPGQVLKQGHNILSLYKYSLYSIGLEAVKPETRLVTTFLYL